MQDAKPAPTVARTSYRSGTILIAVTLAACLAALIFRTEIRSRYWASRLIQAATPMDRATPLTLLCNAGDHAWWGISTLLEHPNPEIRQYGVLILHHTQSLRSRQRLFSLLDDEDYAVRELAALGLAIQGDDSVIPDLIRIFTDGDTESAVAACIAMERLGSPAAVDALRRFNEMSLDTERAAAVIDTLAGIGSTDCVPILIRFLEDRRPCRMSPRKERMFEQIAGMIRSNRLPISTQPAPEIESPPGTIADRAADVLIQITSIDPKFNSELPEEQREAAAQVWREWVSEHSAHP